MRKPTVERLGQSILGIGFDLVGGDILPCAVDGLAIDRRNRRDVLRRLHAPLDLERCDIGFDEPVDHLDTAKVTRAEQILSLVRELPAIRVHEPVGQTTGLGAQTAIRAASADERGEQALTRLADAQRAVDEHLEVNAELGKLGNLFDGKLAGKRDTRATQTRGKLDAAFAAHVHLRRGVQLELGQLTTQHGHEADVLHDGGIDSRFGGIRDHRKDIVHLAGKHEGVGREIDTGAAQMGVTTRSTQVVDVEVVGITTRVERTGTQIDGIGTGGKRRLERLAISRGGEQFRLSHRLVRHRMRIGREALACVLELDPDCLVASRAIGRASLDDLVDVNRLERIRGEVPVGFG